jgi:protein TonB
MRIRWSSWGFMLSAALHVGVAAGVAVLPKGTTTKTTTMAVVESKKKKKKEDRKDDEKLKDEPPPPPPKPIEAPKRPAPKPKAPENTPPPPPAAAPKAAAAPTPMLNALPNLGISMAGGPGVGGIAVPQNTDAPAAAPQTVDAPKAAPPKPKDECTEDVVKPKITGYSQDGMKAAARAAGGIEGKIRVEVLVDESGNITSVRVLSGLGGGVDEAAVAAIKRAKATVATKCGKPVAGRTVMSFTLVAD